MIFGTNMRIKNRPEGVKIVTKRGGDDAFTNYTLSGNRGKELFPVL